MKYHDFTEITKLGPNQIFVFGSNLKGIHGRGAALTAKKRFGAIDGIASGFQGDSYAIPTKSTPWETLTLDVIKSHVDKFFVNARDYSNLEFLVTPIGCGLAGYTAAEIAPMFRDAPDNVILPRCFEEYLG